MAKPVEREHQMCPSAQPTHIGARVFGVQVGTSPGDVQVGYLPEAYPVTDQLLALAGPGMPAEVLRVAAPCIKCAHYDGSGCRLAKRVATMLDPVVGSMPHCAIRPVCLWFRQEGKAACLRCPQVTTIKRSPTSFEQAVAGSPVLQAKDLPDTAAPQGLV